MKKNLFRCFWTAAIPALLIVAMLTGCGGDPNSGNPGNSSNPGASGTPDNTGSGGDTGKVVELTVHDIYNSEVVDFSKPVITRIQELCNVHLTNTVSASSTEDDQAWTLMIANPSNLPDIIVSSDMAKIEKLGMDGGLMPLEDLIEQHCPNVVAAFEKYPELRTASTATDGHIYQIAGMKEMSVANTWIIRQDWLDKFNLPVPTTVDELYTALKTFREQDANGNGEKDETPFITRWHNTSEDITSHALSLWNSGTGLMVRQGKVVYDPMEEEFYEGMKNLIQWYAEGLIDPEVYTREDARNVLYGENVGGLTYDWTASTTQYNTSLAETIPGFDNEVMAPIVAPNGRQVIDHRSVPYAGAGLSQNCSNVEAALRLIDFLYSEEGQILQTYGIEGEHYTINADGTYQFTDEMLNYEGGLTAARNDAGCINHLGGIDPVELEYCIVTDEATLRGYELYMAHPEWYAEDEYVNFNFKYTNDESDEVSLKLSSLNDYVNEKCRSWILGNGNFEAEYESFIAELRTRGVEDVIQISQTAYDRLKG